MKSLDQLDPLPRLGSKIETEVVYFHTEEKEVGPHLYEKDGKLRYAPPTPDQSAWPFPVSIADVKWEPVKADQVFQFFSVSEPQTFEFTTIADHWKAVEEEKQDNKPDDGWISHTPGDPMPCDKNTKVFLRFEEDPDWQTRGAVDDLSQVWWDKPNPVIAWKPA